MKGRDGSTGRSAGWERALPVTSTDLRDASFHLDDMQFTGVGSTFQPTFLVDHPSQFANRQTVQYG